MTNIFNRIIKLSIYLLVFLLPLFWLPFSMEPFEFNKQYLLFFLVSLAAFAWLAKMVVADKEIRFRRTAFDLPVLGFFMVAILSALFSVDKISSVFGFYGRFSNGLLGLLSFGLLYFLITNNLELSEGDRVTKPVLLSGEGLSEKTPNVTSKRNGPRYPLTPNGLVKTFLWSVFFIVLITYMGIVGFWQVLNKFLLSVNGNLSLPSALLIPGFNPISSLMTGLAVFLAAVISFLIGLILHRSLSEPATKAGRPKAGSGSASWRISPYWFLVLAAISLLFIIDFTPAWLVLVVGLTTVVSSAIAKRLFCKDANKLLIPLVLIIVSVFSIFFDYRVFLANNLSPTSRILLFSQEKVLSQEISWQIAKGAIKENVKSFLLGTGIGTFHYDFSKFKPAEFNQDQFWSVRFDKAGNHFSEALATTGLLGLAAYVFLLALFLKCLKGQRGDFRLPLLSALTALVAAQFVYYQNIPLGYLLWLVLGLAGVGEWKEARPREKVFSLKKIPELSLIANIILIFLGLGLAALYYQALNFYRAEWIYSRAIQSTADLEIKVQEIERAVKFNSYQSYYKIILGRGYLAQNNLELRKPLEEQRADFISNNVVKAVQQMRGAGNGQERGGLKSAVELSPNWVVGWETLGMVYRDIQRLVQAVDEWAIKSFEKAIELEPANPVLYTELGKLYQNKKEAEVEKARGYFEKAIELKPDYIEARTQLSLYFEQKGDLDEAIKKMEETALDYPLNVEVMFQLGRLYYNSNRVDEAIKKFQEALVIMPEHSNSLYSLGIIYQAQGKTDLARQMFEKVLQLNPASEDAKKKVEELSGK